MKLFLFDIDGTLLRSHGLGGKAFSEALTTVTGKTYDLTKLDWFGHTDGAILTEILTDLGYSGNEIEAAKPAVFTEFTKQFAESTDDLRNRIDILPGVRELLDALEDRRIALVTGNILATAYLKLNAAGLDGYFPNGIGGFGDDRDVRAELVPIAVERARKHYGIEGEITPVVIGDSHRDVLAAKENGAVCVAVATGKLKSCELAGYQPEYIFEDFSDTSAVLKVFDSI